MTNNYGGSSFDQGIQFYEQAMEYLRQDRKADARKLLQSAKNNFESCTQNRPETATYLNKIRQLGV